MRKMIIKINMKATILLRESFKIIIITITIIIQNSFFEKIIEKTKKEKINLCHLENFKLEQKRHFTKLIIYLSSRKDNIVYRLSTATNFKNQGHLITKENYLQSLKQSEEKKNETINEPPKLLNHTVFLSKSERFRSKSMHQKGSTEYLICEDFYFLECFLMITQIG